MDALSDPRAFMSANKQRDEKMKEMGIEETETSKAAAVGASKPAPEEEIKRGSFPLLPPSFRHEVPTYANRVSLRSLQRK